MRLAVRRTATEIERVQEAGGVGILLGQRVQAKRFLDRLVDVVDVLEYDTLKNNFSFNILLRKKMV